MGVVMQSRNIVSGLVAASLLAGCGIIFDRKQVDYKADAVQTQPLEVPPDLTVPQTEQRYTIPGTDGEKVARYSEYTKQAVEQPCVVSVSAPVVAGPAPAVTPAKLQDTNGVKTILLEEPFDRCWRRVGLAMDRAAIIATDKDRAHGIYFIPAPDKVNKKLNYQVTVRETAAGCEVAVNKGDGERNPETVRLTKVLYENFEK